MKTIKPMGPVEWGLLLILSVLWGASFFFGKVALAELQPFSIVLCRVALAAVALNLDSAVERGCRVQLLGSNAIVQKRGLTRWVS